MRKDRINIKAFAVANIKVLAVLALIVCNVATANAQRHSLEFKGGAIATSTRNNGAGEAKTIIFGLTGTGYFDLVAYQKYHDGQMDDYVPTDEELKQFRARLPKV